MLLTTYTYDYQWPAEYDNANGGGGVGSCMNPRLRAAVAQQFTPRAVTATNGMTTAALATQDALNRMEWVPTGTMGRLLTPKLLPSTLNADAQKALHEMIKSSDFNFVPCEAEKSRRDYEYGQQMLKSKDYKLYRQIQAEKMEKWNATAVGRTVSEMREKYKQAQEAKVAAAANEAQKLQKATQLAQVLATRMDSIADQKEPPLNRWTKSAGGAMKRVSWI